MTNRNPSLGLLLLSATVISCAVIAAYGASRSGIASPARVTALAEVIFLALVALTSSAHGLPFDFARRQAVTLARSVALAFPLWLLVSHLGVNKVLMHAETLAVGIFIPAAIEEIVFRQLIPLRAAEVLGHLALHHRSRTFACVGVSAVLFASCHFLQGAGVHASDFGYQWVRMSVLGVIYAAIAGVGGLSAAITLHAAFNTQLWANGMFVSKRADALSLLLGMISAVVVLWRLQVSDAAKGARSSSWFHPHQWSIYV